jgi:hypothetical protein
MKGQDGDGGRTPNSGSVEPEALATFRTSFVLYELHDLQDWFYKVGKILKRISPDKKPRNKHWAEHTLLLSIQSVC